MLALITAMALGFSLILGPGPAWAQTPPQSPVYQPLARQIEGLPGPYRQQSPKSSPDQAPITPPNFSRTTPPMSKQSFAEPQNLPGQPGSGKGLAKKPGSQVAGPDKQNAEATLPKAGFTPAWKPSNMSGPQPGGLSAGLGLGGGTPGATGLAPLSAYLQQNKIGNCFQQYLQSGFSGRKPGAATGADNRLPGQKKRRQSKNARRGLPGMNY